MERRDAAWAVLFGGLGLAAAAVFMAWPGRHGLQGVVVFTLACIALQATTRPRWAAAAGVGTGWLLGLVLRSAIRSMATSCTPEGCTAIAAPPSLASDLIPLLLGLAVGELARRDLRRPGETVGQATGAWIWMTALATVAMLAAIAAAVRIDDVGFLVPLIVTPAAVVALRPWPALAGCLLAFLLLAIDGLPDLLWGSNPCPPTEFCEGPGRGFALVPTIIIGLPIALLLAAAKTWARQVWPRQDP
ncbi:MAG: hypothetical protein WC876_01340 [Candidatus Thermoplasmatota archaeon]